ncbi:MAG: hypothetical protein JWO91_744 [Acidobacteriaceae bacterium]|nr:hypothetical protein [Acidobacteriaceae bacterium]
MVSLFALAIPIIAGQSASKPKKEKQPRALGLIEISPKGKPRLVPIAILIDGEFYDASAYKAAPVPMALYSDTVYEGVKSGASQGLFTVKGALHGNNTWIAEGSWRSAEEIQAAAARKKAPAATKAPVEDADARPVLRRGGPEKPGSPETKASDPKASDSKTGSKSSDTKSPDSKSNSPGAAGSASPSTAPTQSGAPVSSPTAASTTPSSDNSSVAAQEPEDKNRPALRRGKPTSKPEDEKDEVGTPPVVAKSSSPVKATAASTPMYSTSFPAGTQVFPAISDADGPEPRPYNYQMKPEEEQKFLKKMLGLATIEVQARTKELAAATTGGSSPEHTTRPTRPGTRSNKTAKAPELDFKDVQLRVFDLSNSNEPVLVLMANARVPQQSKEGAGTTNDLQYMVTLVAREDIYAELHKVYANVTDSQHLDVSARVELVDAVDADGDGRGELLFRQVSDAGSAFALYRVIGNQLWPLFQGTSQ